MGTDAATVAVAASSPLILCAEWFSAAAAFIHLAMASVHLEEWWGYGLFFVGAGLFQGAYALALQARHRSDWFLVAGIAANAAMALLYIVSRTAGLPRPGPGSGMAEELSTVGALAAGLEVGIVVALALIFLRTTLPADSAGRHQ